MGKERKNTLIYIFSAVAVAAIAAGVILTLSIFSVGKSISAPTAAEIAEKYLDSEKDGEILAFAEKYAADNLSPYESRENAMGAVREAIDSGLSLVRNEDSPENSPEFTVFCRGYAFLSLKIGGNSVSSVSLIGADFLGKEYRVSVPRGAKLTVNGIEADAAKADKTPYPLLTEFEKSLSETVGSDTYSLGILFSYPDIKAVYKGKNLIASVSDDGTVIFPYPADIIKTTEFSVPYGSKVLVNGIEPDKKYIVDTSAAYAYLTRFEERVSGLPGSTVYRIKGMFDEPDISVTYDGEPLSRERGNDYRLPESMTKTVKITAPDYATVKINDFSLGKAEISADGVDIPILSEVTNYAKKRPHLTEYTVSGLLGEPVITAYGEDGKPLPADRRSSTKESVVFGVPLSEMPEDDKITVKTFAKNYIRYRYSGNSGISSNYNNLIAMTPSKALAYKKLKAEYKKVQKLPTYTKITYGEPVYGDFRVYGDSYSCSVTYPFTAKLDGVTQNFELDIEILYVFSGKIRRVVNYIVY